jgi:hypothetical protein
MTVIDWHASLKGVAFGTAVGIAFGLGGFFFAEIPGTRAMGPVMFLLVPFAAGFAIAIVTERAQRAYAAAILATLGSLAVLIATGMETPLCALIALPLLFLGLMAGMGFAYLFKRISGRMDDSRAMKSIIFLSVPLVVLAGHRVEMSTLVHPRQEAVTSSIWLPAAPGQVWNNLQSFDSLTAEKPALMYIGLPVPIRCTMQGSGQGAKRTCYFDRGSIEETVTEWQPPNRMRYSIDRTNMPGRHWLGFEDAEYDLQQSGGGTILTRNTTIISNLYPAGYWRPFERWGVSSEHNYIFADLARRLKR